ncbi:MAG: hypothetical protein GY737_24240 [Desulfobacteraceae bacterium]|nr:hypothetical protein [Desulfobacteraceae bacterium]
MSYIDLIHCIPESLAESVSIDDLTETVIKIDAFEERQAQVLDYIYRQRLIRLVCTAKRGQSTVKDLRTFAEHMDKVTLPVRIKKLDHLDKPYGARWTAYLEILESRLAALESDAPYHLMNRKNVKEILELILEKGTVSRKQIKETLNLKPANLTRILNMMETSELIESYTVGREKIYSAGANSSVCNPKIPSINSETKRGASYLRLKEAV